MTSQPSPIEWGLAQAVYPGLTECGDRHLVEHFAQGVLLAVIDGLGHGAPAAIAAQAAVDALKADPQSDPVMLIQRCHKALVGTRGAVISLASISTTTGAMMWLGIGNVTGLLLRNGVSGDGESGQGAPPASHEYLHLRGGVVGYNLPSLRAFTVTLQAGDTVIFATDGLRSVFTEDIPCEIPPQQVADYLLENYNRKTDDALVLVARV